MQLFWSPRSPFAQKITLLAHELGLADRIALVPAIVDRGAPSPSVMAYNPLGRIPTLVLDDGGALYDSRTIGRYLLSLRPDISMLPADGPALWEALRRESLGDGLLDAILLWRQELLRPDDRQNRAWLDAFAVKTHAALDEMERSAPMFAGLSFDLGHIALGCALGWLSFRFPGFDWRQPRPALAAWYDTFAARPSACATHLRE